MVSTLFPNDPKIEAQTLASLALTHAMHMRLVHFICLVFFSPCLLLQSSSTIISGYFRMVFV